MPCTSVFRTADDQGAFPHSALLQVPDQRRERLAGILGIDLVAHDVGMSVPRVAAGGGAFTIHVEHGLRFLADVEDFWRLGLHTLSDLHRLQHGVGLAILETPFEFGSCRLKGVALLKGIQMELDNTTLERTIRSSSTDLGSYSGLPRFRVPGRSSSGTWIKLPGLPAKTSYGVEMSVAAQYGERVLAGESGHP